MGRYAIGLLPVSFVHKPKQDESGITLRRVLPHRRGLLYDWHKNPLIMIPMQFHNQQIRFQNKRESYAKRVCSPRRERRILYTSCGPAGTKSVRRHCSLIPPRPLAASRRSLPVRSQIPSAARGPKSDAAESMAASLPVPEVAEGITHYTLLARCSVPRGQPVPIGSPRFPGPNGCRIARQTIWHWPRKCKKTRTSINHQDGCRRLFAARRF